MKRKKVYCRILGIYQYVELQTHPKKIVTHVFVISFIQLSVKALFYRSHSEHFKTPSKVTNEAHHAHVERKWLYLVQHGVCPPRELVTATGQFNFLRLCL